MRVRPLFLSLLTFCVVFSGMMLLLEWLFAQPLVPNNIKPRFLVPPRFSQDDVLWIIKTGKARRAHLEAQLTIQLYKQKLIVSDEETDVKGNHVFDMMTRIAPEAKAAVEATDGFKKVKMKGEATKKSSF